MKRGHEPREASPRARKTGARGKPRGDRQARSGDGVDRVGDGELLAEDPVKEAQERAVAHRVVAPGMPHRVPGDHHVVRVAEAGGDASRAELVVVPVPHGLTGVRVHRPHTRGERGDEEHEPEDDVGHGDAAESASRHGPSRMRRRYVFWTCIGSSFKNLASSVTKPRT